MHPQHMPVHHDHIKYIITKFYKCIQVLNLAMHKLKISFIIIGLIEEDHTSKHTNFGSVMQYLDIIISSKKYQYTDKWGTTCKTNYLIAFAMQIYSLLMINMS